MKLSELKEHVIKEFGKRGWQSLKKLKEYEIYVSTYVTTEEEQINSVKGYPFLVKYLNNPSERVLLEAVKESPFAIEDIDNPSEKVQLEAIKLNPYVIRSIHNPSEKVQLEAIKQDIHTIKSIKNPTEKIIQEVLKQIEKGEETVESYVILFKYLENDLME